MDAKKASDILTQVAHASQKAGLLTLDEAVIVSQAIKVIQAVASPPVEDVKWVSTDVAEKE